MAIIIHEALAESIKGAVHYNFFTNRESDVERCQLQVVCFIVCYTCTITILVLAAARTLSLYRTRRNALSTLINEKALFRTNRAAVTIVELKLIQAIPTPMFHCYNIYTGVEN